MTIKTQDRLSILEQNQQERSKCLVYTRVMGYHRPVESFNIGKKGEHRQRTHFRERHG
jgi:anaerobic ribonucleoside-triphosphate reductase